MKICFISREIYPFYYGGIGTQIYAQMKFLSSIDAFSVYFITEKPKNFNSVEFDKKYSQIKVVFVEYSSEVFKFHQGLNYSFCLEKVFRDLYVREKLDLVLIADFSGEDFFILLKRELGAYQDIPFLMTLHSPLLECLKFDSKNQESFFDTLPTSAKLTCYMENVSIQLSDYFASPSKKVWEEISHRLGLIAENRIIPNSVNTENFNIVEPLPQVNIEKRKIVYAGKLQKLKGVDILLKSFLMLTNEELGFDVELLLIGKDMFWEEYDSSFQAYWGARIPNNIKPKIKFLGHVSQETLRNYFSKAWVCVFPSRWESFGLVALEAITCGAAVIVSDDTGLREVVGENYGIFFSLKEGTEGLKTAIKEVLQDVDLRNQLAKQSHFRAKEILFLGNQLTLNYINYIQRNFTKKPNLKFENLLKVYQEYDKLCREQIQEVQLVLKQAQTQMQEEVLKTERLWAELCQYQQELEQAQAQLQAEISKTSQLSTQINQSKQELEHIQAQLQAEISKTFQLSTKLSYSQDQLQQNQQELQQTQDQLQRTKNIVNAMESSKFWKMRTQWLKMKKMLGLVKDK